MANPQLSNGYVRIANELLEAICQLDVSGSEMRILLYIIRRTYGFNKDYAEIPLSEISAAVGMRREHIQKMLKRLSAKNIIDLRTNSGTKPQTISIVKNYEKWAVELCASCLLQKTATVASTVVQNGNSSVVQNGNSSVVQNGNSTYKDNKDNIKDNFKDRKKPFGRNGNVLLKNDEYNKLINNYGKETAERYIERMDNYISSREAKYNDCYAELLIWLDRDNVKKLSQDDFDADKYSFAINNF
ncbi:MAG: replication protein [Spirochaetales bacterium]|nr:replication protein [Spirochaetales bacterium]